MASDYFSASLLTVKQIRSSVTKAGVPLPVCKNWCGANLKVFFSCEGFAIPTKSFVEIGITVGISFYLILLTFDTLLLPCQTEFQNGSLYELVALSNSKVSLQMAGNLPFLYISGYPLL